MAGLLIRAVAAPVVFITPQTRARRVKQHLSIYIYILYVLQACDSRGHYGVVEKKIKEEKTWFFVCVCCIMCVYIIIIFSSVGKCSMETKKNKIKEKEKKFTINLTRYIRALYYYARIYY